MKKLSVFIALALLAVAGTGYAVTCAYDNVPGATLLVPYWRVSLNGATGAPIPTGGIDTLVSMVNVSTPGIIAHVTVWNKYSKAVLDFNVPMTGKDVVSFSMRDIMNGHLNVNYTQVLDFLGKGTGDPCGVETGPLSYKPIIGFGAKQFIRFSNPTSSFSGTTSDAYQSISVYATDAFAAFRNRVWDSLDESGDITSFTSSAGANILDTDNPACLVGASSNGDGVYRTDLSGYLTIDVVNYCTNYFPENPLFFDYDAIATAGWSGSGINPGCPVPAVECRLNFSPNTLFGDIFYIDSASQAGNISGDQAIALEYGPQLVFGEKTFFSKFVEFSTCPGFLETTGPGCAPLIAGQAPYVFPGDGRESLSDHYGFRYLSDSANGYQTWILVWRSDMYNDTDSHGNPTGTPTPNLCDWLFEGGPPDSGLYDNDHQLIATTYNNDEDSFSSSGGPSGGQQLGLIYVFLESQRISLLNNGQINPGGYKGGWIDAQFRNTNPSYSYNGGVDMNQAWVGVQHTAPGAILSVGHSAAQLNNSFNCIPDIFNFGATKTSIPK